MAKTNSKTKLAGRKSAKSKTSASKNFWQTICDVVVLLLGVLVLGILGLPHIRTLLVGESVGSLSGYDLINFQKGSDTGIAVVLLMLVIFASLMLLFALLKLLCDFHVIKSAAFGKLAGFLMLICASVLLVLAVVSISIISTKVSSVVDKLTNKRTGTVAGFDALTGTIIAAFFAMLSSCVHIIKK